MKFLALFSVATVLTVLTPAAQAASARPFAGSYEAYVNLTTFSGKFQPAKIVRIKIRASGKVTGLLLEDPEGTFVPTGRLKGKVTGIRNELAGKPVGGLKRWVGKMKIRGPQGLVLTGSLSELNGHVLISGKEKQGSYRDEIVFRDF